MIRFDTQTGSSVGAMAWSKSVGADGDQTMMPGMRYKKSASETTRRGQKERFLISEHASCQGIRLVGALTTSGERRVSVAII